MPDLLTQLTESHPEVSVWAAGGIVLRENDGELEVLVVHRPHRADWSFPKGKIDDGESLEQTAVREVEEETGYRCRRMDRLPIVRYVDGKDREKLVVYWTMEVESGAFTPNDEVDTLGWFTPVAAAGLLTYDHDIELLDAIRPPERQLRLMA
ncbi:MAG: NUDIX hydrolase [Acidimicrobiales bacterium]